MLNRYPTPNCALCNGLGIVAECSTCHGKGSHDVVDKAEPGHPTKLVDVGCSHCGGIGCRP